MSLLEPHNLPFAAALCVMAVLAVIQALGLGDAVGDHDAELGDPSGDGAADGAMGGLLSLLGIGRVPFLIWLALFLLLFAAIGLGIQELAASLTGGPLHAGLAAVLSGIAALPFAGTLVRPLAAVLPGDETTAITLDQLLGRRAHITDGTARSGSPARARVIDRHGMAHHVMVQPHDTAQTLQAGDEILLVRREGEAFFAAATADRALAPD